MCDCAVHEHCPICDPAGFAHNREENAARPYATSRNEQEEAAVFDRVMSALTEHLVGFTFTTEQSVDPNTDELVIKITRVGKANPCRIRLELAV